MKPFRSSFVTVRDRRYHVREWGDAGAPLVIFLHGWGDVGASFQFVVDALPGEWRVVAPDWRGFGLSEWNEGPYWFPDYLADLDALLEVFSPDNAARLVGHSMGGIVASLYAGIRPQRVAGLASLEGFSLWTSPPDDTPNRCEKWLRQIRDKAPGFRSYPTRNAFAERLLRDNPRLTPDRARFIAEHALRAEADGFVFSADPHHRWSTPMLFPLAEAKACWRRMSAPTLWLSGRESVVMRACKEVPEDYQARRDCFATACDAIIDDCGHNLHHDQPEQLARRLADFFTVTAG